ncbi:hypothetical protein EC973_006182 [Apophysomyces ossiformis]|uniref:Copper-fist domain-containing protein n=1 Tax=Apophysomyces ossiformis TaxID=679940 RepID=A0A8H7BRC1_9FUNG|nr:hypothetical protein EC973_006182 [Apophysomyces ossiformis]
MYINGIKFACSTCIKGHRSSHCNHTDRPLLEIRKKGRPVTQCAYCRDLRKTRQVHIKCACNSTDKKGSNHHPNCVCQDLVNSEDQWQCRPSQCTCPPKTTGSSLSPQQQPPPSQTPVAYLSPTNVALASTTTVTPSFASPCPTNLGSGVTNKNDDHLNFVFHKPTSQESATIRFLEGQPRRRRRRASDKSSKGNTSSRPPSPSPPPLSSQCQPSLPQQQQHQHQHQQQLPQPPSNFNSSSSSETSPYNHPASQDPSSYMTHPLVYDPMPTNTMISLGATSLDEIKPPTMSNASLLLDHTVFQDFFCGSCAPTPTCQPTVGQGESVVVTITPLKRAEADSPTAHQPMATRIVTCYCGSSCTCPGCLVHPGNQFLLGNANNDMFDPYTSLFQSYSTASSCCGSDDDDQQLLQQQPLF